MIGPHLLNSTFSWQRRSATKRRNVVILRQSWRRTACFRFLIGRKIWELRREVNFSFWKCSGQYFFLLWRKADYISRSGCHTSFRDTGNQLVMTENWDHRTAAKLHIQVPNFASVHYSLRYEVGFSLVPDRFLCSQVAERSFSGHDWFKFVKLHLIVAKLACHKKARFSQF